MVSPNRIFGLDVLRTAAILLVLVSHGLRFAPVSPETHHALEMFMGYMGVELFFALSGFLIGSILLRESENGITGKSIGKFWVRRWMRTLPAYYVVLLGTPLLYGLIFNENSIHFSDVLPYIFFVQNFLHPHPEYFGVAWSLSIEEWFYVLFPFLLFIISLIARAPKSRFFITVIIFLLSGIFMRIAYANGLKIFTCNTEWDSGFRKIVMFRPDAIVFGLSMAWLKKYFPAIFTRKTAFLIAGMLLLVFSTWIFYCAGA